MSALAPGAPRSSHSSQMAVCRSFLVVIPACGCPSKTDPDQLSTRGSSRRCDDLMNGVAQRGEFPRDNTPPRRGQRTPLLQLRVPSRRLFPRWRAIAAGVRGCPPGRFCPPLNAVPRAVPRASSICCSRPSGYGRVIHDERASRSIAAMAASRHARAAGFAECTYGRRAGKFRRVPDASGTASPFTVGLSTRQPAGSPCRGFPPAPRGGRASRPRPPSPCG